MPGDEAGDNVTADPHKVSERPNSGKPDLIGDRMLWANGLRFLNPNERTVLVAVAYHDGPGGAYPSHKLLMAETGLGRSAVAEARCVMDPAGNAKLAKQVEGGRRLRARDDAAAAAILAVAAGSRRASRPRPRRRRYGLAG